MEESEKTLKQLLDLSTEKYVSQVDLSYVYGAMGKKELAFESLDRAFQEHSDLLVYLKTEPRYDPLRKDPRFSTLLSRIGLN
jgi:adenylate cyclase